MRRGYDCDSWDYSQKLKDKQMAKKAKYETQIALIQMYEAQRRPDRKHLAALRQRARETKQQLSAMGVMDYGE